MIRRLLLTFAMTTVVPLAGCLSMGPPGGAGANVGGAQDIALARAKIDAGIVPAAGDFVPEGLYAEHDLPLAGPPCDRVLCVRAEQAIAENIVTGQPEIFVHLGLASNVDLATFQRRPQNLALVIDHSGSMGELVGEGDKLQAVLVAAQRMIDQLDGGDLLTIIEFDETAEHRIGPVFVTDREALKAEVRKITLGGSTCIECGMRLAYDKLASVQTASRDSRVLLFTDALPNVGATGEGEFTTLAAEKATQGTYLTVFGVGLDFGQELIHAITAIRGANYVYLSDEARMRTVFDEDFDLLLTPIAHDLSLSLAPAQGLTLAGIYGMPQVEPGAAQAESTAASVFLSRRKGAIVALLTGSPNPGDSLATTALRYQTLEGATVSDSLLSRFEGEAQPWFSTPGVRKTVALTNFVIGARKACELYWAGDREGAAGLANRTAAYLRAEAEATGDAGLATEAALAEALAALVAV